MSHLNRVLRMTAVAVLVCTCGAAQSTAQAAPLTFTVTYDEAVSESFSGRVYVMLGTGRSEPRHGPSWFNTQPFFAKDVKDWKPGSPLVFDDEAIGFPGLVSTIPAGEFAVQAVLRRNLNSPDIGSAAGNAFSAVIRQIIGGDNGATSISLHIDQTATARPFAETDRVKLAELKSPMLSAFHGRDVTMRAAVILPEGYDENADRKYPALYWIGGFGSDHTSARFMIRAWSQTGYDDQIVRIVLDPLCYGGHHVFADSDNNGPVGAALVHEFIPHLERTFRLVPSLHARFLSGHSSGGWSSLWLQITYPEVFGGVWSIAPDPVDFRDFQRIDLYKPGANMYVDDEGDRRPLARNGPQIMAWYDDFAKMEVVYGEGGQLRSFEWVFSQRGSDGLPAPLYDRATGMVNSEVADTWKRYDIRIILEQNWDILSPRLDAGRRINVFMGDVDTFYLEGATKLLKESQMRIGSKAIIEVEPDKDHGSIATSALRQRIDRELMAEFVIHHPEFAPETFKAEVGATE